jgi:hypothetical protein
VGYVCDIYLYRFCEQKMSFKNKPLFIVEAYKEWAEIHFFANGKCCVFYINSNPESIRWVDKDGLIFLMGNSPFPHKLAKHFQDAYQIYLVEELLLNSD